MRGGMVIMGVALVCWRGFILLFDQSSRMMMVIMGKLKFMCTTIQAYLKTFGRRSRSVMWARSCPFH